MYQTLVFPVDCGALGVQSIEFDLNTVGTLSDKEVPLINLADTEVLNAYMLIDNKPIDILAMLDEKIINAVISALEAANKKFYSQANSNEQGAK